MREIREIIIHHSASKEANHTWEEIRQWHLNKGWQDIGYHWGVVFDVGGWQVKQGRPEEIVGAHAKGRNRFSVGICVEGNYEDNPLPTRAYELLKMVTCEVASRHQRTLSIAGDVSCIYGHRELPYATLCPGKFMPLNELRGAVQDYFYLKRKSR